MASPTPKSRRAGRRKFSETEKIEICKLWKMGKTTVADLIKEYGRSASSYYNLFGREGVKYGEDSAATKAAVEKAVVEGVVSGAVIKSKRVTETNEEHYKLATMVVKIMGAMLIKSRQEGKEPSTLVGDMKALQLAAMILRGTREERYATCDHVAGIVDDDDIPELNINEVTAEDIRKMQERLVEDESIDIDKGLQEADKTLEDLPHLES